MPTVSINGVQLHLEESGQGAETVVFSHGLLGSTRQFAPQIRALRLGWRCLAYDHRGQGRSQMPAERTIEIETLYQDALALIRARVGGACHFVGMGLGGLVGLRLASRNPELLRSLTLIAATPGPTPRDRMARYELLSLLLRVGAGPALVDPLMALLYGRSFMTDGRRAQERDRARQALRDNPRRIYRALNGLNARHGIEDELGRIGTPTLVIHGEEDLTVPVEQGRRLAERIASAMFVPIPKAGHTASLEQPEAVTAALETFLEAFSGRQPRA